MKRAIVLCASVVALTQGCRIDTPSPPAASGAPRNAYFIGPQPGPHRGYAPVLNPYGGNARAATEGRQLFVWYNCYACHGDHAGGGMGPSLRDSTWLYGGDPAAIFASVTEGRRYGMPAWGTKLPQDQIWKIVTYIGTLRTPNEPDRPR